MRESLATEAPCQMPEQQRYALNMSPYMGARECSSVHVSFARRQHMPSSKSCMMNFWHGRPTCVWKWSV